MQRDTLYNELRRWSTRDPARPHLLREHGAGLLPARGRGRGGAGRADRAEPAAARRASSTSRRSRRSSTRATPTGCGCCRGSASRSEGAVDSIQLVSKRPLEQVRVGRGDAGVGDLGRADEGAPAGGASTCRSARRREAKLLIGDAALESRSRTRRRTTTSAGSGSSGRGCRWSSPSGRARARCRRARRARGRARRVGAARARGAGAARARGERALRVSGRLPRALLREAALPLRPARARRPAHVPRARARRRRAGRVPELRFVARRAGESRVDRGCRRSSRGRSTASGSPTTRRSTLLESRDLVSVGRAAERAPRPQDRPGRGSRSSSTGT